MGRGDILEIYKTFEVGVEPYEVNPDEMYRTIDPSVINHVCKLLTEGGLQIKNMISEQTSHGNIHTAYIRVHGTDKDVSRFENQFNISYIWELPDKPGNA